MPGIADRPRPQEQYFQESPFSDRSRDSWENWTLGERIRMMESARHHIIPDMQRFSCGFHTAHWKHFPIRTLKKVISLFFSDSSGDANPNTQTPD